MFTGGPEAAAGDAEAAEAGFGAAAAVLAPSSATGWPGFTTSPALI